MKDFQVVSFSKCLCDEGLEISLAAFSELFNSVTFKHQRKMNFNLVTESNRENRVWEFAKDYGIEDALTLISYNEKEKSHLPINSTVLMIPTEERVGRLVREALAKDIPVMSFINESITEYVDHTCGVFIRKRGFSHCVEDFSRALGMLYFDPEVRKLFHRAAKNRYQEISGLKKQIRKTKHRVNLFS